MTATGYPIFSCLSDISLLVSQDPERQLHLFPVKEFHGTWSLAASLRDTRVSFSHAAIHWDIVRSCQQMPMIYYDFSKLCMETYIINVVVAIAAQL